MHTCVVVVGVRRKESLQETTAKIKHVTEVSTARKLHLLQMPIAIHFGQRALLSEMYTPLLFLFHRANSHLPVSKTIKLVYNTQTDNRTISSVLKDVFHDFKCV